MCIYYLRKVEKAIGEIFEEHDFEELIHRITILFDKVKTLEKENSNLKQENKIILMLNILTPF